MSFLKFLFAMFLSFLPGIFGIMVSPISTGQNIWYNSLYNSALTPAGWVFSVAWTVLYILIGWALYLVMQSRDKRQQDKVSAYVLFTVNIILNTLWSFVFFGAQSPKTALIVLVALIIVAIFMMRSFFRINKLAGYLIIPYILWMMFAAYLNGMIIYLN